MKTEAKKGFQNNSAINPKTFLSWGRVTCHETWSLPMKVKLSATRKKIEFKKLLARRKVCTFRGKVKKTCYLAPLASSINWHLLKASYFLVKNNPLYTQWIIYLFSHQYLNGTSWMRRMNVCANHNKDSINFTPSIPLIQLWPEHEWSRNHDHCPNKPVELASAWRHATNAMWLVESETSNLHEVCVLSARKVSVRRINCG